jgi:molybdate transport system ATP-binding protein
MTNRSAAGRVVIAPGLAVGEMGRTDLASILRDDVAVVLTVTVGAHEDDDLTRLDFAGGTVTIACRQ